MLFLRKCVLYESVVDAVVVVNLVNIIVAFGGQIQYTVEL